MIRTIKTILVFTAFLFLTMSVSYATEESYTIRSGASPTLTNSGIFLAKELGYFDELGLNVEIYTENTGGASQIILLASGQLDTGGGGFSTGLFNAINQGENIKVVACKSRATATSSHWSLLVRTDHIKNGRYKTFKDLKGFQMTLPALQGSAPETLHDAFLKAGGLTYKDVTVIKMPYSNVDIAFEKKEIDATVQVEPYATKSILNGNAVRVAMASEVLPGLQGAAIFYSPDFTDKHPELAEKWMIAYLKGVRAYHDAFFKGINKKNIIQMLKKYVHIDEDEIWEKAIPAYINPNGYLNLESIQQNINWYIEKGYLNKGPAIKDFVDQSFVEKALEKIGFYNE